MTFRNKLYENSTWQHIIIDDFIKQHDIPVSEVFYTNHCPKGPICKKLCVKTHYDDDPEVIHDCKQHGVEAILVEASL